MAISEYAEEFAGKPVVDWEPQKPLPDPVGTVPRLSLSYEDHDNKQVWLDKFSAFIEHPDASQVTGLVIGVWDWEFGEENSQPIVDAIVSARDKLPNLTAIFLGDIVFEECEISWIRQSDVTPLLEAFPQLEYFTVRGGEGLRLRPFRHDSLRELVIQTGGLNVEVVRAVCASELPALQHLELWLGTDEYGANATVDDLEPIFSGRLFPRLRYLGLRDSEMADAVARAVANAPIVERLEVLDLSLGTLGDEGAQALLDSPLVAQLQKLDVHHHFCTDEMAEKLRQLPIEVDVSETQHAEEYNGEIWRFVAHSE